MTRMTSDDVGLHLDDIWTTLDYIWITFGLQWMTSDDLNDMNDIWMMDDIG